MSQKDNPIRLLSHRHYLYDTTPVSFCVPIKLSFVQGSLWVPCCLSWSAANGLQVLVTLVKDGIHDLPRLLFGHIPHHQHREQGLALHTFLYRKSRACAACDHMNNLLSVWTYIYLTNNKKTYESYATLCVIHTCEGKIG